MNVIQQISTGVTFIISKQISQIFAQNAPGETPGEIQECNGTGNKAYIKSSIVRLQNFTSSGIKHGFCCHLTELDNANLCRFKLTP